MLGTMHARMRDDQGVALITVIGVISVLTVLATSAFYLARESYTSTARNQAESEAFQIANAGIDTVYAAMATNTGAEAVLAAYTDPQTLPVGNGNAVVELEREGGIDYVVTSTGHAKDGTVEVVKVRFYYLNLWEMFIAAGEDQDSIGGGAINGNASVDGPFYVRGDLGATGTTDFTRGPLFVTGDISRSGNFTIGTTDVPIDVYVKGSYPEGDSRFHARRVSNSVPDITAPPLDDAFLDTALSRAKQESFDNQQGTPEFSETPRVSMETWGWSVLGGPGDPSTYESAIDGFTRVKAPGASAHYKYIGPNAGRSPIGEGATDVVIGDTGSFGSWENDGRGYTDDQWDDFAFDDVNDVLYVEGTVFIDGDLIIDEDVTYRGNGALVVNGDVYVNGNLYPAAGVMSQGEVVGIISSGSVYVEGDGNTFNGWTVQCAIYAKESLNFTKQNAWVKGSIVSPQINFPSANFHLESDPKLPTFLPWSMPGRDAPILVIGAWSRQ